jgi:hypothetical protein
VTVNRATTGYKTALVTRPIWLFGTDDYLEVADNALLKFGTGDFTMMVVARQWETQATFSAFMSKMEGTPGYRIYSNSSGGAIAINLNDGTNDRYGNYTPPALAYGSLQFGAGGLSGANVFAYTDGTRTNEAKGVFGSTDGTSPLYLGYGSGDWLNFEGVAFAIWDRALSDNEFETIRTYYGTV